MLSEGAGISFNAYSLALNDMTIIFFPHLRLLE